MFRSRLKCLGRLGLGIRGTNYSFNLELFSDVIQLQIFTTITSAFFSKLCLNFGGAKSNYQLTVAQSLS